jgi:DNA-binding LacI/PurR family transcriptional regulator
MPVTIQDIAKKLGISVSTVSKALNNYSDVSEATRYRVQKIAHDLGYYPSATAQSLRRRQTNRIGLVVNYPIAAIGEYLSQLIIGAALAAEHEGYHITLYPTAGNQNEKINRIAKAREADGLLMLWATGLPEVVQMMKSEKTPFVVVSRRVEDLDVPYVVADNKTGAFELTKHLISLGHKRIGYTPLPILRMINKDRMAGYRQALEEAGIPFDEELLVPVNDNPKNRYQAMNKLLDLQKPPSAVFAFHDYVAIQALRAATDRGLRVPEDVAIAGFDGMHSTLFTSPPLTTVSQPIQAIGQRAVEILIQQISGTNSGSQQIILPTQLIERQSTLGKIKFKSVNVM